MDSDLPIATNIDNSPDRLRQDLFDRLHWNVFGPLGDISVRDDNNTLVPFANHALVSESIAEPPLSRIVVQIDVCQQKHSMDETDEEEYRYQPPEPLVIENMDGSPILLGDFVAQVHSFLNDNEQEIYKCEDEMYTQPGELEDGTKFVGVGPEDTDDTNDSNDFDGAEDGSAELNYFLRSGNIPAGARFFFDTVMFNEVDVDEFEAYVSVFVEGNMGTSLEQFWGYRARA